MWTQDTPLVDPRGRDLRNKGSHDLWTQVAPTLLYPGMDSGTTTSLDPGMWTRVTPGLTREVGIFEMRGHMTFGLGHPNFVGPGYVDQGTP